MLEQLRSDKTALILGDDGTPAAYLVDPETYRSAVNRLELLEAVAVSERDVAQGRTLTHEEVKERMKPWLK